MLTRSERDYLREELDRATRERLGLAVLPPLSPNERIVLEVFRSAGRPLKAIEVIRTVGDDAAHGSVRKALTKLTRRRLLVARGGRYELAP